MGIHYPRDRDLYTDKQLARVEYLHKVEGLSKTAIATRFGIGTSTVHRMLQKIETKKK
jgi:DNA-binding transcriptional regulator LsrR (DeoR family)